MIILKFSNDLEMYRFRIEMKEILALFDKIIDTPEKDSKILKKCVWIMVTPY